MSVVPDHRLHAVPIGGAVTVVVVAADPVVRRRTTGSLAGADQVRVVRETCDVDGAASVVEAARPRVVLLDVGAGQLPDPVVVARLARLAAVLVLMDDADRASVMWAVRAGARGYLVHGHFVAGELVQAVLAAARGEARFAQHAVDALIGLVRALPDPDRRSGPSQRGRLSPREIEIMGHIARGAANSDIAQTLYLSEKTVRNHVNHIYAKLGVRNRAQAMVSWLGTGTAA